MLRQKDLDEIEKILEEKLEEKIGLLPTKAEFFSKMGEQTIVSHQVSNHEDCLEKLEKVRHAI